MSRTNEAAAWAEAVAYDDSHGYDQANRWGPDYDCSSLVIDSYERAGVPVKSRGATYTGNMRRVFLECGFKDVKGSVDLATGAGLERGDVLLNERSHTAIYLGGGKIVNASGNEKGGVSGGKTGDQTGREIAVMGYYNFPWDCVLRYVGEITKDPAAPQSGVYIVKQGDSLWSIAERELGDGFRYEELRALNNLDGYTIYQGQVLKLPGKDPSAPEEDAGKPRYVKVTVEVREDTLAWWKGRASKCNYTMGEMIDALADKAGFDP